MALTGSAEWPTGGRSVGRAAALGLEPREESPGSMEIRCRVTPGEGDLRDSATEIEPPEARLGQG